MGIFEMAGSPTRIAELQLAFDSPPRYGKDLDWTGNTVHDAANLLLRYLIQLPEPVIPYAFYDRFQRPAQQSSSAWSNSENVVTYYESVITELPPLNRQLLFYILDVLAVFADKSSINLMTTIKLAALFQSAILEHPGCQLDLEHARMNQSVVAFLIEKELERDEPRKPPRLDRAAQASSD